MNRVDLENLTFTRDLSNILDIIDDCVFIVDREGRFVLYNRANARLDNLDPKEVIGKHITEVYNLNNETSITLKVLQTQKPVLNVYQDYEVIRGKEVASISSAYPVFTNNRLSGAIIITKDMNVFRSMLIDNPKISGPAKEVSAPRFTFDSIIGSSSLIKSNIDTAMKAAKTKSSVLVYGDTGTGKEMIIQSIHNASTPRDPFIPLNCAAIPENLLEGLLFGTSKGAFTGSLDHVGLFEKASGGTLFLDELNSMNLNLQAKLLRVIEEGKVMRVGENRQRTIKARFMSALSVNPLEAVEKKMLRHDLFYRLGVVIIRLPSLRERLEDIPAMLDYFIEKYNAKFSRKVNGISAELMDLFKQYNWPGNVRELEHAIESAMNLIGEERVIGAEHLSPFVLGQIENSFGLKEHPLGPDRYADNKPGSLLKNAVEKVEKDIIMEILRKNGGNISAAAGKLGMKRQSLHYKINKYGIK